MEQVAIVIPIYKSILDSGELMSLKQCIKILANHPIILICPSSLDLNIYKAYLGNNITVKLFSDEHFRSIKHYNQLLISREFYKRFIDFEYILIYQLDAWVFKDELAYWCNQSYDYIGAPWFEGWSEPSINATFTGVGNGGFSLRNVKKHLKILNSFSYIVPFKVLFQSFINSQISLASLKQLFINLTIKNNTFHLFNDYQDNEDLFWGLVVNRNFDSFKVPDLKIASKFSLEVNAKNLFNANQKKLPFGCHAWEKYDSNFWAKYILYD